MNFYELPCSKLLKKYDDEDEYDFYSVDKYLDMIYSESTRGKNIRFTTDSKKIIVKFSIKDIEKCNHQIIGTAAYLGITCLYRPICEKNVGWKPLDSSATRNVVASIKLEMHRYETTFPYEVMVYLPIYSKIDEMEIGVLHNSMLTPYNPNEQKIYMLGNMIFENGINTSAYYLPNILSRKTDIDCINYSGNDKYDIKNETVSVMTNVRFIIIGINVRDDNVEKVLADNMDLIDYIVDNHKSNIIVFKSPIVFYNNHELAAKINNYYNILAQKEKYKNRVYYVQMKELENQMFLYNCTLSCNFLNDYGYVCLGKCLSQKINELKEKNNG